MNLVVKVSDSAPFFLHPYMYGCALKCTFSTLFWLGFGGYCTLLSFFFLFFLTWPWVLEGRFEWNLNSLLAKNNKAQTIDVSECVGGHG